jgi:hypothetical protein
LGRVGRLKFINPLDGPFKTVAQGCNDPSKENWVDIDADTIKIEIINNNNS